MNKNAQTLFLLSASAISGTTPIPSSPRVVNEFDAIGLQLITTSTGQGTWLIEASADYEPGSVTGGPGVAGTWSDVTAFFTPTGFASVTTASNKATQTVELAFKAFRVTFTPSTGAGTVTALAYVKARA